MMYYYIIKVRVRRLERRVYRGHTNQDHPRSVYCFFNIGEWQQSVNGATGIDEATLAAIFTASQNAVEAAANEGIYLHDARRSLALMTM